MSTLTVLRLALLACIFAACSVGWAALTARTDSVRTLGLVLCAGIILSSMFFLVPLILEEVAK